MKKSPQRRGDAESAEFTPGPWQACLNVPAAQIPGHIIKTAYEPYRPIASLWEGGGTSGKPTQVANAHLIATAPELLLMAEKAKAVFDDLSRSNPGWLSKLTLQDYATLNELLAGLPRVIAYARGKAVAK